MHNFYDRRSMTERRLQEVVVAIEQRILPDRRLGEERRSGTERRDESRIDVQNDRRAHVFEY